MPEPHKSFMQSAYKADWQVKEVVKKEDLQAILQSRGQKCPEALGIDVSGGAFWNEKGGSSSHFISFDTALLRIGRVA
jgi:hypothetical protein